MVHATHHQLCVAVHGFIQQFLHESQCIYLFSFVISVILDVSDLYFGLLQAGTKGLHWQLHGDQLVNSILEGCRNFCRSSPFSHWTCRCWHSCCISFDHVQKYVQQTGSQTPSCCECLKPIPVAQSHSFPQTENCPGLKIMIFIKYIFLQRFNLPYIFSKNVLKVGTKEGECGFDVGGGQ